MNLVETKLSKIQAKTILDVASGAGNFIKFLKKQLNGKPNFWAIDNNEKAIAYLKKHSGSEIIAIKMEAENMNFPDLSFDAVTMQYSLHHLEQIEKTINEMLRVLKPDGYLIINEMFHDKNQTNAQKNHTGIHHWIAEINQLEGIFHRKTFSKEQIEAIFKKYKFKDINFIEFTYQNPDPKNPKLIERYIKSIDNKIAYLEENHHKSNLINKGEELKNRLNKFGYSPCTSLYIFAKK